MSNVNFTYTNLTPFKWYVLENFPFIEADFDALTNWQLFCKLGKEINKIIPAVNKVGQQTEDLTTFVTNYFNNLDVQEEINNKLDQMAQTGELEEIIGQYLKISGIVTFNTVAEMKNSTNIIEGSRVKTFGFYNFDDNGGAYYLIRKITNEDTVDEKTIIALNDNTLIAELFIENQMSPKQFGAKGDGITDDTISINTCINKCNKILFDTAVYLINAVYTENNSIATSINLKSNRNIDFNNSVIKMKSTTQDLYYIIRCYQENNIILKNGIIEGYDEVPPASGTGSGMGIAVMDCTNVLIDNFKISHCRGDGIYIREYSNQKRTNNITVSNCYLKNNRRNQVSLTGGEYVTITNCHFIIDLENTTDFEYNYVGIDLEGDHDYARMENFVIENCQFLGQPNAGISLSPVYDTTPFSGFINNCNFVNCKRAFYGASGGASNGDVVISNITITNTTRPPIEIHSRGTNNYGLYFDNIILNSFNFDGEGDYNYMFWIGGNSNKGGVGKVHIKNPVCKANCPLVFMNNGIQNVSLIDPIFENGKENNSWGVLAGRDSNSKYILSDSYNQIVEIISTNKNTSNSFLPHICKTQNTIEDVTVNINPELVPENEELTFINTTLNNFFVGLSGAGNIKIPGGTTKGMLKAKKIGSSFVWWGSSGVDFAN